MSRCRGSAPRSAQARGIQRPPLTIPNGAGDPRDLIVNVCRLVAHHSCAVIEAEERGLAAILRRDTPPAQPLADALTFRDMTTSTDGEHVHVHRTRTAVEDAKNMRT